MARKQRSVEEIIGKLREAEVALAQGESGPWRVWPWRKGRVWPWRKGRVWPWRKGRVWPWRKGRVWPWRKGRVWPWRKGRVWPWRVVVLEYQTTHFTGGARSMEVSG